MSKLTRQTMLWFGSTSDSSSVGVFGSLQAGSPTYSKVIATIQGLPAWGSGWKAEVIASERPALQDFNAVDYVFSYGINYLYQMGIPEWDSGTVYYQYSYCQISGVIYYSLQNNNVGQNPVTASSYWTAGFVGLSFVDLVNPQTVGGVKTFTSFPVTPFGAPTTDYQVANKKYVDDNQISLASAGVYATSEQSLPSSYGLLDGMTNTQVCTGTKLLILFNAIYHTGFSGNADAKVRFKVDGSVVWTQTRGFSGGGNTADMNFFSPCQFLATGLTPGSHTVTVEMQNQNTTDPHIFDRSLIVLDLP